MSHLLLEKERLLYRISSPHGSEGPLQIEPSASQEAYGSQGAGWVSMGSIQGGTVSNPIFSIVGFFFHGLLIDIYVIKT